MAETKVKGLPELRKALAALPGTIQRRALRAGLSAAGRVVRDKARAAAPVKSGALKRNIQFKMGKIRGNSISVLIGVEAGPVPVPTPEGRVTFKNRRGVTKSRKLTAREKRGDDPYYYRFQEAGFTAVGRRKARSGASKRRGGATQGTKVPGKWFLRNALENNKKPVEDAFIAASKERIERGG